MRVAATGTWPLPHPSLALRAQAGSRIISALTVTGPTARSRRPRRYGHCLTGGTGYTAPMVNIADAYGTGTVDAAATSFGGVISAITGYVPGEL